MRRDTASPVTFGTYSPAAVLAVCTPSFMPQVHQYSVSFPEQTHTLNVLQLDVQAGAICKRDADSRTADRGLRLSCDAFGMDAASSCCAQQLRSAHV